jgi:hypothetical protein
MARKPEPSKPIVWNVYKIASKAVWLRAVEAVDEATAMEKGAAEFGALAKRLTALRRCPAAKAKSPAAISSA